MKLLLQKAKSIFRFAKEKTQKISKRLPKINRQSPKYIKTIKLMNRYAILLHMVLSCCLCFTIEWISRRSFGSAISFLHHHTMAFSYNSFVIFASLSIAFLVRKRAVVRLLVSGVWLFLGTINGCILANRVTPFSYTDLKLINDLLAMENTSYFTASEATLVVCVVAAFLAFCIMLFIKGPKYQGNTHKVATPVLVASTLLLLPVTTQAAQSSNILASYFGNIAQGYENYGFVYGFSSSVVGRGMNKPDDYSEETVAAAMDQSKAVGETTNTTNPNIICILLESFIDPAEIDYLQLSADPIPNFRNLYENYSSGYLTVPVVGAGTANTEFEILTGMSMQYFGTGEYPYKTILKQTDCESLASDLSNNLGYGTHVVHNNGGNFYSRANAFSMMGFDSFTSKEMMNIQEYTPLGSWATDDILIDETLKAMDTTPETSDFVYTITVEGHGDYPTEKILPNPEITVSGAADEAANNQWEYYCNMIHEVDKFIGNLTAELEQRGEDTIVVMFGDHLPTMGLEDSNMKSGSIFKTKYATWNNFGLPKQDADVKAYELLANITNQLGIHEGTIFTYEQQALNAGTTDGEVYYDGLNNLQYDLLYGERYAYNGEDKYPASDLVMGVADVTINNIVPLTNSGYLSITGSNYTNWSKVFINGEKVPTTFVSSTRLRIPLDSISDGDTLVVNQMGSSNTVFRSSNEVVFDDPAVTDTETTIPDASSALTNTNGTGVNTATDATTGAPVLEIQNNN